MPLIHSKEGKWTGEWGNSGFGSGFDFDLEGGIENVPAQEGIDFDKEAYYQSIVAPAEAARRDATTEAFQQAQALTAHTGRAPGDLEGDILAGSIRQAGATSAAASQAAEEGALKAAEIEQADLTRRTQAAVAVMEIKAGLKQTRMKIQADYQMMREQQAFKLDALTIQLGAERANAEMAAQSQYEVEMFKINAGMEMLRFKEDSANLRAAAGVAQDERESQRTQAYRMEYLDRMSKIQSMNSILDWVKQFGLMSLANTGYGVMGYGGNGDVDHEGSAGYNPGENWWENPDRYSPGLENTVGTMGPGYEQNEYYNWP